jgi:magnesium transporter
MTPTAELLLPEVLELIDEGRFVELRTCLHEIPAVDVADMLASLDAEKAALGFRFLSRDDAGEVFSFLEPEKQEELIQKLGAEGSVRVVEAMSADDRAALLDELPAEVAQRIVASLSAESRRETQAILGYPPRSVGRLMTPDYVRVRPDWTCEQAIAHVRRIGKDAETINVLYIIDEQGKLIDDVRLREVILADPETRIYQLQNNTFYSLQADQPQAEAVRLMNRYDRTALPVLDSRGVLVGIVTIDDVSDVAQEEVTEDIQKLGGVQALEEPFDTASVWWLVRKRAPWLAMLYFSELLTTNALSAFQSEMERAIVLGTFVPAIISAGGNSGSQSSTLVIRALALGEIKVSDWWRVLRRELAVAGVLGLFIGLLGMGRISLWGALGWFVIRRQDAATGAVIRDTQVQDHFAMLGVTIATSLIGVVLWGSVMGSMLPFLLKRLGLDPAGSSTPFVATLVDVTGILIYFFTATTLLRGTLL